MQRIVTFDGPRAAKRFDLLQTALLSGGDGKGDRNRSVLRSEARLLDALDLISEPSTGVLRRLVPDATPALSLTITQEDHDLLQKYVDTTPWLPVAARDAVDVQDWVSAAERVD